MFKNNVHNYKVKLQTKKFIAILGNTFLICDVEGIYLLIDISQVSIPQYNSSLYM